MRFYYLRWHRLTILNNRAAYSLTIRVHGSDGQAEEKQEMLLSLLPFIREKSILVLKSISGSIDYVLGNAPEGLVCTIVYIE